MRNNLPRQGRGPRIGPTAPASAPVAVITTIPVLAGKSSSLSKSVPRPSGRFTSRSTKSKAVLLINWRAVTTVSATLASAPNACRRAAICLPNNNSSSTIKMANPASVSSRITLDMQQNNFESDSKADSFGERSHDGRGIYLRLSGKLSAKCDGMDTYTMRGAPSTSAGNRLLLHLDDDPDVAFLLERALQINQMGR